MMRRAIYPGSFDPPTLGHQDLIERASVLFDEVIVGVGINTSKNAFLTADERCECLKEICKPFSNVSVEQFNGLLVHFANQKKCQVLVRGLRAVTDFDYEFRVALANRRLDPAIETVFLIASEENSFLASSVVREIAKLGGDVKPFVPEVVLKMIEQQKHRLVGS